MHSHSHSHSNGHSHSQHHESIAIKDTDSLLPSYSYSSRKSHSSLLTTFSRYIRTILQNPQTRKVFYFFFLNLSFTFIEFIYGYTTNSLGLISDAIHMLFDCSAIFISLIASVISKWEKTTAFSYGFSRVETLTGFVNAVLLGVTSIEILWEAIERMFHPPKLETETLLIVAIAGLVVNIVGIFAFDHGHIHHGGGHGGHSHSHSHSNGGGHDHGHHGEGLLGHFVENPLMEGMFLHVLSDTLGSVGVIVSTLLIRYYEWYWSDPLCSIIIGILTLISIYPLLRDSGLTLLQRAPLGYDNSIPSVDAKIRAIPGVLDISQMHFWELSPGNSVGTLKVQVAEGVNEQRVRLLVANVVKENLGVKHLTVQVEMDVVAGY